MDDSEAVMTVQAREMPTLENSVMQTDLAPTTVNEIVVETISEDDDNDESYIEEVHAPFMSPPNADDLTEEDSETEEDDANEEVIQNPRPIRNRRTTSRYNPSTGGSYQQGTINNNTDGISKPMSEQEWIG